jgi:hypothetical protein
MFLCLTGSTHLTSNLEQDPVRALVTTSKLILVVPPGADTLLTILEENMQEVVSVMLRA